METNKLGIEYINIIGFLGKSDVKLDLTNLVNIYVGENGCGKSLVLKILNYICTDRLPNLYEINFNRIELKIYGEEIIITHKELDNWLKNKSSNIPMVRQELSKYGLNNKVVFVTPENTFVDINLCVNYTKIIESLKVDFINSCSKFLSNIPIKEDNKINYNNLSSGEKQILYIFSQIYSKDINNIILLIDEPEQSLSILWQEILIPTIFKSNKCGLIMAMTHSPFIFENEYFDECTKELIKEYVKRD